MIQQQQGDVWIEEIDSLPMNLRSRTGEKKYVLAEGETHGHKHQLIMQNEGDVLMYEDNRNIFMEVKEKVALVHEEHYAQDIKPGIYKVGNIHEYDYHREETVYARD